MHHTFCVVVLRINKALVYVVNWSSNWEVPIFYIHKALSFKLYIPSLPLKNSFQVSPATLFNATIVITIVVGSLMKIVKIYSVAVGIQYIFIFKSVYKKDFLISCNTTWYSVVKYWAFWNAKLIFNANSDPTFQKMIYLSEY